MIQTLRINPFTEPERVQKIWCALESKVHVSFFNSWGWISTWLTSLPKNVSIELIVNIEKNEPICCFFIGRTNEKLNRFKKNRAFLNNTGIEKYDDLVFEYNSILCASEDINRNLIVAINHLKEIEEFRFFNSINISFDQSLSFYQRTIQIPSYWIDLNNIDSDEGYISCLSKNKRNQIKRSVKAYESEHKINIAFANNISEAKGYFIKLEALHQKEWVKRGKPGAFAEPFFRKFHNQLIESRFEHGEIQIVRIFTDKEDIGYLYNFIFNNEVLFYQSGFNYKKDNKFRPGIVSHYLTIKQCIEKKHSKYNFLAGTTQYKQSLATHSDTLNTIVLSRKTIKSHLEHFIRYLTSK